MCAKMAQWGGLETGEYCLAQARKWSKRAIQRNMLSYGGLRILWRPCTKEVPGMHKGGTSYARGGAGAEAGFVKRFSLY